MVVAEFVKIRGLSEVPEVSRLRLPENGHLYLENITQADYTTQKAQYDTTRDSGETAAGRARAEGVGTANVDRATGLQSVETTLGTEIGTPETTRLAASDTAQSTFDTGEGPLDSAWISTMATQHQSLADGLAAAWRDQTARIGTALVTFQNQLGQALVANLQSYAAAEGAYQKATAERRAAEAADRAADVDTETHEYRSRVAGQYTTQMAAVTQADQDWWTAFSDAWHTLTSESMGALETYVHGIAPAIEALSSD